MHSPMTVYERGRPTGFDCMLNHPLISGVGSFILKLTFKLEVQVQSSHCISPGRDVIEVDGRRHRSNYRESHERETDVPPLLTSDNGPPSHSTFNTHARPWSFSEFPVLIIMEQISH